jgi:hypothetical protein
MKQKGFDLAEVVENAALHYKLIGDYPGAYSLGVTSTDSGGDALLLQVETEDLSNFPREVLFLGQKIQVIVRGSFRRPTPLGNRNVA